MDYSKYKDAEYPDAETRAGQLERYCERQGVDRLHRTALAYYCGQYAMHLALDQYLWKQYYLRDQAIKILEEGGDPQEAIAILKQIGG